MPGKITCYRDELRSLLLATLEGAIQPLEDYLTANSNLPGPRGNLELIEAFAQEAASLAVARREEIEKFAVLLDGWATLSLEQAPVNSAREILPAIATLTYGQMAVTFPEWWEDEVAKLRKAALNPRWRTREMAATALQKMLKADWERACGVLYNWLESLDPLLLRAVVAAIAEPPVLTNPERGQVALDIQAKALAGLLSVEPAIRKGENWRVLRQALGYAISVAFVADPASGLPLLQKLAANPDPDAQWILRENLKKNRLARFNLSF